MPSDEQNQIGANNRRRRVLRKMLYLLEGVAYLALTARKDVCLLLLGGLCIVMSGAAKGNHLWLISYFSAEVILF